MLVLVVRITFLLIQYQMEMKLEGMTCFLGTKKKLE